MIQHIVLLKWKPGVSHEEAVAAVAQAEDLPNQIDGVSRIALGRNRGSSDHGFTHALIVELRDEDALARYLEHPLRRQYIAEHLAPIEQERIEVDVPVDLALHRQPSRNWEWGSSVGMGPPLDD